MALGDDAACDVQAEAGALARLLGCEKGLECAGSHAGRHSRTGVADVDDDVVLLGAGGQPEHAFSVHRFDGVVDEGGPYLVELADVGLDRRAAGGGGAPPPDPLPYHMASP